jgi:hypothetical protein
MRYLAIWKLHCQRCQYQGITIFEFINVETVGRDSTILMYFLFSA